jgi:hypothetical protein
MHGAASQAERRRHTASAGATLGRPDEPGLLGGHCGQWRRMVSHSCAAATGCYTPSWGGVGHRHIARRLLASRGGNTGIGRARRRARAHGPCRCFISRSCRDDPQASAERGTELRGRCAIGARARRGTRAGCRRCPRRAAAGLVHPRRALQKSESISPRITAHSRLIFKEAYSGGSSPHGATVPRRKGGAISRSKRTRRPTSTKGSTSWKGE